MGRRSRVIILFLTAAFLAAAAFWASRPVVSPGLARLDTQLVWAESNRGPTWPALTGNGSAYIWGRGSDTTCTEVRCTDLATGQWNAEGDSIFCMPVASANSLYTATSGPLVSISAFDLDSQVVTPPALFRPPYRTPVWTRSLPEEVATGMTYDNGVLYAATIPHWLGGWVSALDAHSGKVIWRSPAGAPVGAPAVASVPAGMAEVVVNFTHTDGAGWVVALDAASGAVLWHAKLPVAPTTGPVIGAGMALVCGALNDDRPVVTALDLTTGLAVWTFLPETQRDRPPAPGPPALGSPVVAGLRRPRSGGVAVSLDAGLRCGVAYLGWDDRVYAIDLTDGRLLWEHTPDISATVVIATKTLATTGQGVVSGIIDSNWSAPPTAPWVTAPTVWNGQILFGTPDGLRAVSAADGHPLWGLGAPEVGAVDLPPRVEAGVAYIAGLGWPGGPMVRASSRPAAYAIRLDAPAAGPLVSKSAEWPWVLAVYFMALVTILMRVPSAALAPKRRWVGPAAAASVLAAIALVALFVFHPLVTQPENACRASLAFVALLLAVGRRRRLAVLAGLSLVFAVATALLWVRGLHAVEQIGAVTYELHSDRVMRYGWLVSSEAGGLNLQCSCHEECLAAGLADARQPGRFHWNREVTQPFYPNVTLRIPIETGTSHSWHGFGIASWKTSVEQDAITDSRDKSVTFPDWSVFPLSACFPALWLARAGRRYRSRRRKLAGCCLACGYNLTGNQSGTCPECGTPTAVTAGTTV